MNHSSASLTARRTRYARLFAPRSQRDLTSAPGWASDRGRDGFEDLRPDVDLDRRGEQLAPLTAAAGDQPGGERQEERGQLEQRVRQDAEQEDADRDVQLEGDRRALEAEVERLGREREEGNGADEEDRQLAGLDVDPAREAVPLLGRERHRGAGDEAGDAGGRVQRQDQRV